MSSRVLLVEDDRALRELLVEELEAEAFEVHAAASLAEARAALEQAQPELVVSDLRLPDGQGLELLPTLADCQPRPALLIITAFGSVRQAVDALKCGADDFLTKPLDIDHFLLTVRRLLETRALRGEVQRYRSALSPRSHHGLFGESAAMRQLFEHMQRVAQAEGPVLVIGESGTGKELVARALHEDSARAKQPYLIVNCGSVPHDLMESEFFGHTAGAFTGAQRARSGLLQQADGGTLVLDEIGEMPLLLQAKLLRALQDGSVRAVGSDREQQVDVRIIACTHRDLEDMVARGEFREDLYYRLETFALRVPPLRERDGDVLLLAQHFLTQLAAQRQHDIAGFSDASMALLRAYNFPGNVRELQNAVERAVTFCDGRLIEPQHLPARMRAEDADVPSDPAPLSAPAADTALQPLEAVQREHIERVLQHTGGNKAKAAAVLGITRRTLYRWLKS